MAKYCVNKNAQSNGDHEVHNLDVRCSYLPDPASQQDLGEHANCRSERVLKMPSAALTLTLYVIYTCYRWDGCKRILLVTRPI